jgi:hypothetical protein
MRKREQSVALMVLAAAAGLGSWACGGSGGRAADAGADAAAESGGADSGTLACDPAAQDCPADQKCDFRCQGSIAVVDCQPGADGGAIGSMCATAMPCARGTGCVSVAGMGVACRKYCAGDSDCATGERCHNVTVAVACGAGPTSFLLHLCY